MIKGETPTYTLVFPFLLNEATNIEVLFAQRDKLIAKVKREDIEVITNKVVVTLPKSASETLHTTSPLQIQAIVEANNQLVKSYIMEDIVSEAI